MKPILFNGEMVKAILDGRKTATRRVIKPLKKDGKILDERPPYQLNDILYVRETWLKYGNKYYYRADFESDYLDPCETLDGGYPASCIYHPGCVGCTAEPTRLIWHPSIHMPKEAARIFLKVTDLRVERLQDITIEKINNEGVDVEPPAICKKEMPTQAELRALEKATERQKEEYFSTLVRHKYMGWCDYADNIFEKWKKLWDSTIPKNELGKWGWEVNPFVWVIQFEQIEKPEQKG